MDFNDRIKQLADQVTCLKDSMNREKVTRKSSVVSPCQISRCDVKSMCFVAIWLLCLSCTPKPTFYFTPSSYDQKGLSHTLASPTHLPQAMSPHEGTLTDSAAFMAAAPNAEDLSADLHSQALPVASRTKVAPVDKAMSSTGQTVRVVKLPRAINEKRVSPSADKPPVHKLAWLSFIFGLLGLAFTFTGIPIDFIAYGMLLSYLAAVITGGIAIKKIKREPDRFSGKGLAKAVIIIVAVVLVLTVVVIGSLIAEYGQI